jgi:hypothetical protein
MKTWMEERDLFIAQTMAFVKEVAASTSTPASPQTVVAPTHQQVERSTRVEPEQVEAAPQPIARLIPLPIVDERAGGHQAHCFFQSPPGEIFPGPGQVFPPGDDENRAAISARIEN